MRLVASKLVVGGMLVAFAALPDRAAAVAQFVATGSMHEARTSHRAALLPDGTVLITGGETPYGYGTRILDSAEKYSPADGTFALTTTPMRSARLWHTATLLPNGKVLIVGGTSSPPYGTNTAELYDPADGTFADTGSLRIPRFAHTATLLPNGKVLIAGGDPQIMGAPGTAELYDPLTGSFTDTGEMSYGIRWHHTATVLPNGKVLIAGGSRMADWFDAIDTAEIYDPVNGSFIASGQMHSPRTRHTATLLPNGKVLIFGGSMVNENNGQSATAELYDPVAGTFVGPMDNVVERRMQHTATLLPNGKVLIAGNAGGGSSSAEVYDPSNQTFTQVPNMSVDHGGGHTATLLPTNGKVLIAGGNGFGITAVVELYGDPQLCY